MHSILYGRYFREPAGGARIDNASECHLRFGWNAFTGVTYTPGTYDPASATILPLSERKITHYELFPGVHHISCIRGEQRRCNVV